MLNSLTPLSRSAAVAVTHAGAQITGDLNVVVVVWNGLIADDRVVSAVGTHLAPVPLSSPGAGVMPLGAFRYTATQRPEAPSALTARAASSSQINLGWTASKDGAGYRKERCAGARSSFTQIGTSPGISYADSGLQASAAPSVARVATPPRTVTRHVASFTPAPWS